jgi:hypothetical protein
VESRSRVRVIGRKISEKAAKWIKIKRTEEEFNNI